METINAPARVLCKCHWLIPAFFFTSGLFVIGTEVFSNAGRNPTHPFIEYILETLCSAIVLIYGFYWQ